MPRLVLALLVLRAFPTFAQGAAVAPTPPPPVPPSAVALFAGSAALLVIAAGFTAGYAGAALPNARFDAVGRPDPLALAGGFAIGFALNLAVTHLLVPEFTPLGNGGGWVGSSEAARDEGWRVARWAGLAAVVGLATLTTGALLERSAFGRGQWLMLGGAGLFFAATLTWDVLEPVFAWRGFVSSRLRENS